MNRKHLIIIAVVALAALAGCNSMEGENAQENADKIAEGSGQDLSDVEYGGSYIFEVKMTEKNQMHLVQKRPPFEMDDSLERQNLIQRYQYLNDKNNVHHVYLMSNDGKVVSYFVAQGKVSSVNSKLTNDLQPVRIPGCDSHNEGNDCWKVVESPQMDGSYGSNGDAIFFFTTSGEYVEWNGKYVVSEKPLNIQTAVSLEHETTSNETSG